MASEIHPVIHGLNIENFGINTALFRFINGNHTQFFDNFFLLARFLGRAEVVVIILIFLFIRKRKTEFIYLLLSSVITALFVISLKVLIAAPRPASFLDDVHLLLPYYKMSFPSGDSAVASLILVFFFRKVNIVFKALLLVYWFVISYGRIYMGVHFPLDVIAGFLIALFSIIISPLLFDRMAELFNCIKNKKLV